MLKRFMLVLMFSCMFTATGCVGTQVKTAKNVVKKSGKLIDNAVRDILKTEVRIACSRLSAPGGYADNPAVLIALPENLKDVRKKLASLGLDGELKKIEKNINNAAEAAAGEALTVFIGIVKGMKIKDAMDIIRGGDTAATKFLRKKGEARLREAFTPIILKSLEDIRAAKDFNKLVKKYNSIPFVKPYTFSIEDYVTDRALEGLFLEMGKAEMEIRKDPSLAGDTAEKVFNMLR